MLGDCKNNIDLYLVEVKHKYDDCYEILGIFDEENDIPVAKSLYLEQKQKNGISSERYDFRESKHTLGDINY